MCALRAGSNRLVQVHDWYWRSPESGDAWYTSRQLNTLRAGRAPSRSSISSQVGGIEFFRYWNPTSFYARVGQQVAVGDSTRLDLQSQEFSVRISDFSNPYIAKQVERQLKPEMEFGRWQVSARPEFQSQGFPVQISISKSLYLQHKSIDNQSLGWSLIGGSESVRIFSPKDSRQECRFLNPYIYKSSRTTIKA